MSKQQIFRRVFAACRRHYRVIYFSRFCHIFVDAISRHFTPADSSALHTPPGRRARPATFWRAHFLSFRAWRKRILADARQVTLPQRRCHRAQSIAFSRYAAASTTTLTACKRLHYRCQASGHFISHLISGILYADFARRRRQSKYTTTLIIH